MAKKTSCFGQVMVVVVASLVILQLTKAQQLDGLKSYWPSELEEGQNQILTQAMNNKIRKLLEDATAAESNEHYNIDKDFLDNQQVSYILDRGNIISRANSHNNEPPMALDYMDSSTSDHSVVVDPNLIEQLRQQLGGEKGEGISYSWALDSSPSDIMGPVNDPFEFHQRDNQPSDALTFKNNEPFDGQLIQQLMHLKGNLSRMQQQASDKYQLILEDSSGSAEPAIKTSIRADDDDEVPTSTISESDRGEGGGGEYIDHPLALSGHLYVQGGAGEGRQLLGPEGTFENVQVVKTDHAVPSYCDPPNPCPEGFTAKDGCLEDFVNSASFSREYQAKQQCACDNEHSLFNCASPMTAMKGSSSSYEIGHASNGNNDHVESSDRASVDRQQQHQSTGSMTGDDAEDALDNDSSGYFSDKLGTLARAIQNRFGNMGIIKNLMSKHEANSRDENADNNGINNDGTLDAINAAGIGNDGSHYTRDTRKSPIIMD